MVVVVVARTVMAMRMVVVRRMRVGIATSRVVGIRVVGMVVRMAAVVAAVVVVVVVVGRMVAVRRVERMEVMIVAVHTVVAVAVVERMVEAAVRVRTETATKSLLMDTERVRVRWCDRGAERVSERHSSPHVSVEDNARV